MAPLKVRIGIWLRLMLLQAAWNYRRMQTAGWLLCAWPYVRWRAPGREAEVLGRLVIHFNTHPLLAPLLVGAALRALGDDEDSADEAKHHLVRWMGTFGAVGDLLYWRALLWNVGWLSAAAYLALGPGGVLALASLWLGLEFAARVALFEVGYRRPERIAPLVQQLAAAKLRDRLTQAGLIGAAAAAGVAFGRLQTASEVPWPVEAAGAAGALVAVAIAAGSRFRGTVLWLPGLLGLALMLLD